MQQQAAQLTEEAAPELLSAEYALFPVIRWFNSLFAALLFFGLMQSTDVNWKQFLIALVHRQLSFLTFLSGNFVGLLTTS